MCKKTKQTKKHQQLALFYSSIPTWWWRLQRSWCHWVNRCLFLSIYPPQHGHCWPRCQPSDSECLRSCHLWDTETVWHWDMKEQEVIDKPTVEKKRTNQQISQSFIFVQFFSISIFHPFPESQHVSPPPPQGLRSQMSHSPEPLSILVMRCVGDTHKHSHTNQLHEFQWAVSLDTRYSWCLSGGSNQTYWAALLPLMASSNTVTYLANPHERTGSQHRRALLQSRGSYQQKLQTNFHSQTLTGDILCQSTLENISLYMLFFYRTSEDCNLVRSYFPLPAHFK